MSPIIDETALWEFIDHAELDEARKVEAALNAMAASVRMRVVELETMPAEPVLKPVQHRRSYK